MAESELAKHVQLTNHIRVPVLNPAHTIKPTPEGFACDRAVWLTWHVLKKRERMQQIAMHAGPTRNHIANNKQPRDTLFTIKLLLGFSCA